MGEHKQYWYPRRNFHCNSQLIHDRIMQKLPSGILSLEKRLQSPGRQLLLAQNNKGVQILGYLSERHLKSGKFIVALPKVIKIDQLKTPPILHCSSLMRLSKRKESDQYFPKLFSIHKIELAETHNQTPENNKMGPSKSITKHKSRPSLGNYSKGTLHIKHQSPDSILTRKLIPEAKVTPLRIYNQIKKQPSKKISSKPSRRELISAWVMTDQELDHQF